MLLGNRSGKVVAVLALGVAGTLLLARSQHGSVNSRNGSQSAASPQAASVIEALDAEAEASTAKYWGLDQAPDPPSKR